VGIRNDGMGVALAAGDGVGVWVDVSARVAVRVTPPRWTPEFGESAVGVTPGVGVGCGVCVALGAKATVIVSVSAGAGGVSVSDGARHALMPQAVIANSATKTIAGHVLPILAAFRLPTLLFPHSA
jgi:hypothetical protein